jgi:hypothetical protein
MLNMFKYYERKVKQTLPNNIQLDQKTDFDNKKRRYYNLLLFLTQTQLL